MEPSHILSVDEIWAADDIHESTVEIPEWGGSVRVRALTLEQISRLADKSVRRDQRTGRDMIDRERSVVLTLIYGMIDPVLTEADAVKLNQKSATAVTRIVQAINALGLTDEAIEEATKSDAPITNGALSVFASARAGDDAS